MFRVAVHKLFFLVVAVAIATSSVVSAARLAPQSQDDAALAAYLSIGGTWAELCGDDGPDGQHRCEYCNLVADVAKARCSARHQKVVFDGRVISKTDLVLGAFLARTNVSPRAPPVVA